jgi:hypothetical protein
VGVDHGAENVRWRGEKPQGYPIRTFGQFNNPSVLNAQTKNNFQVSLGFGWRF